MIVDAWARQLQRNALRMTCVELVLRDRESVGRNTSHLLQWLFDCQACRVALNKTMRHLALIF